MNQLWQFLVTKNPRMDYPPSAVPTFDSVIIDATMPAGLESDDVEALMAYVEKYW
jgi:hypothetical protein